MANSLTVGSSFSVELELTKLTSGNRAAKPLLLGLKQTLHSCSSSNGHSIILPVADFSLNFLSFPCLSYGKHSGIRMEHLPVIDSRQ